jgi:hypothetical protein
MTLMVMFREAVVAVGVALSVTVTVKVYVPAAAGAVPASTPVVGESVKALAPRETPSFFQLLVLQV